MVAISLQRMRRQTTFSAIGNSIAAMLYRSWRENQTAPEFSARELETIAPFLLRSGAAALAWRRIRESELRETKAALELQQAYRLYCLHSRINNSKIEKVFRVLRAAAVEPMLIKGWAAARNYPEPGLRPFGDIDICVQQPDFQKAQRAIAALNPNEIKVDLHRGFRKVGLQSEEEVYARSRLISHMEGEIRIPSPEDHLRIICFHFMREGAWRPLWLADVCAALESCADNFDWKYLLASERSDAPLHCAIGLAHRLLGAEINDLPDSKLLEKVPDWVVTAVLREWSSTRTSMQERHAMPMIRHLRKPRGILKGLQNRWPNPVEATTVMSGPFNNLPRLPIQIGAAIFRMTSFVATLSKSKIHRS